MNVDQALALIRGLLAATMMVAGPILVVALIAGVAVGIFQTVTQINEAGISFLVKLIAVIALMLVLGPVMMQQVVAYARNTFASVTTVVH